MGAGAHTAKAILRAANVEWTLLGVGPLSTPARITIRLVVTAWSTIAGSAKRWTKTTNTTIRATSDSAWCTGAARVIRCDCERNQQREGTESGRHWTHALKCVKEQQERIYPRWETWRAFDERVNQTKQICRRSEGRWYWARGSACTYISAASKGILFPCPAVRWIGREPNSGVQPYSRSILDPRRSAPILYFVRWNVHSLSPVKAHCRIPTIHGASLCSIV